MYLQVLKRRVMPLGSAPEGGIDSDEGVTVLPLKVRWKTELFSLNRLAEINPSNMSKECGNYHEQATYSFLSLEQYHLSL